MKTRFVAATLFLGTALTSFALAACGDSGGGAGGGNNTSTTGGQNCSSSHVCVNNVCNCGSDGKGQSCTSDTACESECQVCN